MQTAEFSHKLDALQEKRTALHARVTAFRQPGPPAVPAGVLAELAAALEELTVAEEEVRQQQDELLAAHLALAEDRHRYAELFNGAPDGYLVTDTMGRISEANLAAAALFQRPQQFLIGRLLAVLVARSERRRLYALLGELAAGKAVGEQEVRFALRAGTTFEVALTVSLMRTTCGQVVGMRWLLRDSTKRNQMHQLLQATTEELERRVQERTAALEHEITEHKHDKEALRLVAEQLHRSHAELQQIAYVSSHDLQEPLRMVTSYVQLLARRYQKQLDAEAQEFIGFAVEGAQRMKALIDGLLAYLGVETQEQEFGSVACETVLATVLTTLQPAISESQAVLTHDRLPTVRGQPAADWLRAAPAPE
jgi:PAS domain S-box-containing protein